jgi:hypothetical protein
VLRGGGHQIREFLGVEHLAGPRSGA